MLAIVMSDVPSLVIDAFSKSKPLTLDLPSILRFPSLNLGLAPEVAPILLSLTVPRVVLMLGASATDVSVVLAPSLSVSATVVSRSRSVVVPLATRM